MQYDIKHKNINFVSGHKILIKFDSHKQNQSKILANKYRDPFTVIEKCIEANYRV